MKLRFTAVSNPLKIISHDDNLTIRSYTASFTAVPNPLEILILTVKVQQLLDNSFKAFVILTVLKAWKFHIQIKRSEVHNRFNQP